MQGRRRVTGLRAAEASRRADEASQRADEASRRARGAEHSGLVKQEQLHWWLVKQEQIHWWRVEHRYFVSSLPGENSQIVVESHRVNV